MALMISNFLFNVLYFVFNIFSTLANYFAYSLHAIFFFLWLLCVMICGAREGTYYMNFVMTG